MSDNSDPNRKDARLTFWNVRSGKSVKSVSVNTAPLTYIRSYEDPVLGSLLIVGCADRTVRLWKYKVL